MIDGLVEKPLVLNMDELIKRYELEEKTGKKEKSDSNRTITNKTLSPNIKLFVLIYKFLTASLN